MEQSKFRPYRGLDERIQSIPIEPNSGYVYFATDTGKIYLDYKNERVMMGNTGASLLYADEAAPEVDEFGKFYLYIDSLEDPKAKPKVDDLILNSDGSFYRVTDVFEDEGKLECLRLAVSGTGGGGGGTGPSTERRASIKLGTIKNVNLINGQDFDIPITGTAEVQDGEPVDESIYINYEIYVADNMGQPIGNPYAKSAITATSGVETIFKAGPLLRPSTKSVFKLWVTSLNGSQPSKTIINPVVYCDNLELKKSSEFSNLGVFSADNILVRCLAIGNMGKILEYVWDGEILNSEKIDASNTSTEFSYKIPAAKAKHGLHTLEIRLYQRTSTDEKGQMVPSITYEIAVVGNTDEKKPIIWLGDFKKLYKNYDNIKIPFLVYDPNMQHVGQTTVEFYKRGINLEIPRTVNCTAQNSKYNYFEITDADHNMENFYSISCGIDEETKEVRDIRFTLEKDRRDMTIENPSQLRVNFSAKGRSNNEAASRRSVWQQEINGNSVYGVFDNFNWYNNGWVMDDNNETCLRISNGASFKIPFGSTTMAAGTEPSAAFELQFKLRNVQDYANLIQNITRYNNDDLFYTYGFSKQDSYTNYDAFLNDFLRTYPLDGVRDEKGDLVYDAEGNLLMYPTDAEGNRITYDKLEFSHIQKNVNLAKTICRYISGTGDSVVGFALGTQDCFFSNGSNKVTAPYVENEMVNLSIVYQHSATSENSRLMTIYVNGMMTGVINSTVTSNDGFTINTDTIEFNSAYCDIDLYRFRVYKDFLSVKNVVKNYAVDHLDVDIYDQNNIAELDSTINEYRLNFQSMLDYNALRKDNNEEPLMPYIIFDTTNSGTGDKLSWSKSTDVKISVTFKNTGLDYAYETGELERMLMEEGYISIQDSPEVKEQKIKEYYQHHCPSWTGNYVNMAVQGTSSEFYPRRNYKLKTKTDYDPRFDDDVINIHLNDGPFLGDYKADPESTRQEFFYMNNDEVGTTKFTMKIDYMESSGTYNMGFANLVYNAYSKHPLAYYDEKGAFQKSKTSYEAATSFDSSTKYFIKDGDEYVQDKEVTASSFSPSTHFVEKITYIDTTLNIPGVYRTSVQGFPVLAFHKKSDGSYHYIGRYNMLLDKGSDECYGFKPSKSIVTKFVKKKGVPQTVRKAAECWEFSNNSRTYCSFRDPLNRYDLSFKVDGVYDEKNPISLDGNKGDITKQQYEVSGVLNSVCSCPIVADSFEYRYNDSGDALDYIYDPIKESSKINDAKDEFELPDDLIKRSEFLYSKYANWEKAVKWVWSTNADYVGSEGEYSIPSPKVGENEFESGVYYIMDSTSESGYRLYEGEYDSSLTYFSMEVEDGITSYKNAYVSSNIYAPGKYYLEAEGSTPENPSYTRCYDEAFDSAKTYYHFIKLELSGLSDEELRARSIYKLTPPTGTSFELWEGVRYPEGYYKYDTKEYREAKFRNDLEKHFNRDYLATYFVMTEVFECYDSRGKNAMFASWGPMEEGGDYIWFPIFYDIDTQLGINNTGIPSFDYSIDATVEGTFSTSDSVLWNNYYKYFKADIVQKYKQLKGENSSFGSLLNPPLKTVSTIRKWYKADPEECNNIAMRGQRPLIALNLDEYYKYLTIMNPAGTSSGKTGYQSGDGNYITDNGTYLYALQGNRDLYITQFITNRIDYIDSWLNVGNYQRGGANNIWGRMAANNRDKISDLWIESESAPYFDAQGNKVNEFDAEYWVTVSPVRKTYVTVQDDNGAYPSVKYNGSPLKVYYNALERGVRSSLNYPEQLVYIYGIDSMGDIGDISKMYWQEFKIVGEAKKLKKLIYGYDALMTDKDGNIRLFEDNELNTMAKVAYGDTGKFACRWYNSKVNPPSMPSGKDDSGMPLLQEVNFSNIQVNRESPTLNLTSCEKLQNFRATGSNYSSIKFAEGVALHTLYLPASLTALELTEARLLTHIIDEYEYPVKNKDTGALIANDGLYIEGFTDCGNGVPYASSLTTINIVGDNLGYDSYILMNKLKEKQTATSGQTASLTMTGVNWSPYVPLTEGDLYESSKYDYYIDDNHYGLTSYNFLSEEVFNLDVLNGKVYRKEKNAKIDTITDIEIFKYFLSPTSIFKSATSSSVNIPNITGTIYIHNTEAVDEMYIKDELVKNFPELTFIFNKVDKAYSAKFLIPELVLNKETNEYYNSGVFAYAPVIGSKEKSIQKIAVDKIATSWFANPYTTYITEKTNFDFFGWGYYNPTTKETKLIEQDKWDASKETYFNSDVYEYEFHAIFDIHKYEIIYHNVVLDGDKSIKLEIPYGDLISTPSVVPVYDENGLEDMIRLKFIGYTSSSTAGPIFETAQEANQYIVDPTKMLSDSNKDFYALFVHENVLDMASPESYFSFRPMTYNNAYDSSWDISGYQISPKAGLKLAGKITIPAAYEEQPVIGISGFSDTDITHLYFMDGSKIRYINACGKNAKLKVIDYPSGCTELRYQALFQNRALLFSEKFNTMPLFIIAQEACAQAFNLLDSPANRVLKIPHTVKEIKDTAFSNMAPGDKTNLIYYFDRIDFGDAQHPLTIVWDQCGTNIFKNNSLKNYGNRYNFNSLNFYVDANENNAEQQIVNFLKVRAFDQNHMDENGYVISTANTLHYKERSINKVQ